MKIDKKKTVFGSVLVTVILFIVAYSMLIFGGEQDEPSDLQQTLVPELQQEEKDFTSKLDAVNALKEVRETTTPSIYDEKYLDSMGYYDPEYEERQKERIVDSIYNSNSTHYSEYDYHNDFVDDEQMFDPEQDNSSQYEEPATSVTAKELGLEHQLFYASNPDVSNRGPEVEVNNASLMVEVDGDQVVQAGYRLRMRLSEEAVFNNISFPKNTPVFGFISFQPNRALIEIENIDHYQVKLKAYDLQDGSEGIYVENNIRADASREIMDDIIQDINVAGIPQVGGLKQLFQRNNRNIKVHVTNNYKLILKAERH